MTGYPRRKHNKDLLPAVEAICNREEDNGVKKISFRTSGMREQKPYYAIFNMVGVSA
jgi:hypothetical protein